MSTMYDDDDDDDVNRNVYHTHGTQFKIGLIFNIWLQNCTTESNRHWNVNKRNKIMHQNAILK